MEMDREKPELMPMHYGKKKKKLEEEKEKIERERDYYQKRRKSNKTEIIGRSIFLALVLYFVRGFWTGEIQIFMHPHAGLLFAVLFVLLFGIPLTVLIYRSIRIYISEEKMRKECEQQIEAVEDEINNLKCKIMLLSSKDEETVNDI